MRELSGGRVGSLRAPSLSLYQRTKPEALSSEFFMDRIDDADADGVGMSDTPLSGTRSQRQDADNGQGGGRSAKADGVGYDVREIRTVC